MDDTAYVTVEHYNQSENGHDYEIDTLSIQAIAYCYAYCIYLSLITILMQILQPAWWRCG